jgi:hypothetical protein
MEKENRREGGKRGSGVESVDAQRGTRRFAQTLNGESEIFLRTPSLFIRNQSGFGVANLEERRTFRSKTAPFGACGRGSQGRKRRHYFPGHAEGAPGSSPRAPQRPLEEVFASLRGSLALLRSVTIKHLIEDGRRL